MKREARAALAVLLLGVLLGAWLGFPRSGDPELEAPTRVGQRAATGRGALSPADAPTPAPATSSSRAEPPPSARAPREAEPASRPAAPSTSSAQPGAQEVRGGHVLSEDGRPFSAAVHVFEARPGHEHFGDYGDETPEEVQALVYELTRGGARHLHGGRSDAEGRYALPESLLGERRLLIVAATGAGVGAVFVAPGAALPDVVLRPRRTVRVTIEARADPERSSLVLTQGGGPLHRGLDLREGQVEFELPAQLEETLHLQFSEPSWATRRRAILASELRARRVHWKVLSAGATVEGLVLGPTGEPGKDLAVSLAPSREEAFGAETTTDADGRFAVHGLPTGEATLTIPGTSTTAYHQARVLAPAHAGTIRLRASGRLKLTVSGFRGVDDRIDFFAIQRLDGETWRRLENGLLGVHDPDWGGDFEHWFDLRRETLIHGVPPGRYRVVLGQHSLYTGTSSEAEVLEGQEAQATLRLAPKPETKLSGRLDAGGADLAGREATIDFSLPGSHVRHTFPLPADGSFSIDVRAFPADGLALTIRVPTLGLWARVQARAEAPQLGTIVLERAPR